MKINNSKPVLFYFGHPSQYLFFRPIIQNLRDKGIAVVLTAKTKDILIDLLEADQEKYYNILPEGRSNTRKSIAYGLFQREFRLFKILMKHKPRLLVGTDPTLAHQGFLFRIPVITTLEDDYTVIKSLAWLTFPFTNCILTPDICDVWRWSYKKIGYKGYMKLSYLHPANFLPDRTKVAIDQRFVMIRLAALTAHHDFGKKGLSEDLIEKLIEKIHASGRKAVISSEYSIKPKFGKYLLHINPSDIHHYLYAADLLISDSQSMSVEAAMLGTPSIRFNDFAGKIKVLEELEHKYHLTFALSTSKPSELLTLTERLLKTPDLEQSMLANRELMLSEKTNVSEFVTWFILHYPLSFQYCRHHDLSGSPVFKSPPVTSKRKTKPSYLFQPDFTFGTYQSLVQAMLESQYDLLSFSDYFHTSAKKFIIIRQDVDDHKENSLKVARLQDAVGIHSTFYFRMVPDSYDPVLVDAIASMGHEIGYHYEDMDLALHELKKKGLFKRKIREEDLFEPAIELFERNLGILRKHYPVQTICAHGSPMSSVNNKAIWKRYRYQDFGIIGEPYFDIDFNQVHYMTDTGRCWNGFDVSVRDKINVADQFREFRYKSTFDIIKAFRQSSLPDKIHMTFHPQRWCDNPVDWSRELIFQSLKNLIKAKFYVQNEEHL